MSNRQISERSYAIRSFKEVTEQAINYQEQLLDRHEKNMRKLLTFYKKSIRSARHRLMKTWHMHCSS